MTITVAGFPAGVTADPLTIMGDTGTLTLHATADATQGDAALTVTAAGGTLSHDAPLSLLTMGPSGTLDRTFSFAGTLSQVQIVRATAMVIQPDGKIVIAGVFVQQVAQNQGGILVARYLSGGALDSTFSGGVVTLHAIVTDATRVTCAVTLQPDGKVVVAGTDELHGLVARLNSDGSLDSGFGAGGKAQLDLNGPGARTLTRLSAIALQPDGGIIVAGDTDVVVGSTDSFLAVVARLAPSGVLDTSFGTAGGRTTTALGAERASFLALVLQPDGRIVAVGVAGALSASNNNVAAFARFNRDGNLDSSFSGDGFLTIDLGGPVTDGTDFLFGASVALQPDGKIVTSGGASAVSFSDSCLVRLNGSDGSPDRGFGTNGVKVVSLGVSRENVISGLALQPDGKFVVSGNGVDTAGQLVEFVARFGADALLDFGFSGGISNVPVGDGDDSGTFQATALDADGRIVVTGFESNSNSNIDKALLARFWP